MSIDYDNPTKDGIGIYTRRNGNDANEPASFTLICHNVDVISNSGGNSSTSGGIGSLSAIRNVAEHFILIYQTQL